MTDSPTIRVTTQGNGAARNAFNAWAKSKGVYPHRREGVMVDSTAAMYWDAWIVAWCAATADITPADAKRAASYLRHLSGKHDASYRRVAAFLDRLADV